MVIAAQCRVDALQIKGCLSADAKGKPEPECEPSCLSSIEYVVYLGSTWWGFFILWVPGSRTRGARG